MLMIVPILDCTLYHRFSFLYNKEFFPPYFINEDFSVSIPCEWNVLAFLIFHSEHRFVGCHITISSITSVPVSAKPCLPPLVVKPLQHLTTLITRALSEFISSPGNFCRHYFCDGGGSRHSIQGVRKGLADDKAMSVPPSHRNHRDYLICKVPGKLLVSATAVDSCFENISLPSSCQKLKNKQISVEEKEKKSISSIYWRGEICFVLIFVSLFIDIHMYVVK